MVVCFKHNRYFRVGQCPVCVEEIEQQIQNEYEIRLLEWENKQPIVLWERAT